MDSNLFVVHGDESQRIETNMPFASMLDAINAYAVLLRRASSTESHQIFDKFCIQFWNSLLFGICGEIAMGSVAECIGLSSTAT